MSAPQAIPPDESTWFYARDRQRVGPVSWGQLKELAVTGQLRPQDMILQQGEGRWTAAATHEGLFPNHTALADTIDQAQHRSAEAPAINIRVTSKALEASNLPETVDGNSALSFAVATTAEEGPLTRRVAMPDVVAVPGYVILGELGRGGMGVVYQANQVSLKRPVALKMILAGVHADAEDLARFRAEAEAVARLQHPNFVQIHEVGEHESRPYFSLELVDGGSLASRLAGTPQPALFAATVVRDLASAIHSAHVHGIVHRDLKPGNVLMTRDGIPKITDFGLAKRLDDDSGQTRSGAIVGTPSYMAPEQATARRHDIGPRTDVYALGAILYEMLTGRPPFRGETPMDTVLQVTHEDPVPPRRLQPKVPLDLQTIALKCLEKEPGKRYVSAEALAADLGRYLAGEPILARPIGASERMVKWAKRRPAVAAMIAVTLLVGTVGVAGVLWQWRKAEAALVQTREAQQAEAEASRQARAAAEEAEKARDDAQDQARVLRRHLYLSNMGLAFQAKIAGQTERLVELLNDLRPRAGEEELRGFEWYYLWRLCHAERLTLRGHSDAVRGVAFSRTGQMFASGSRDGTVKLWDAVAGAERFTLRGHTVPVHSVAFSADGTRLASAGCPAGNVYDIPSEIKLWDVTTRRPLLTFPSPPVQTTWVLFTPDGKHIVVGSGLDASSQGRVVEYDVSTGQARPVASFKSGVMSGAFSADGRTLVLAVDKNVRLWDLASGTEQSALAAHFGSVLSVACSPDGRSIASGDSLGYFRLWDAGGTLLKNYHYPTAVSSLTYTPDSKVLIIGCGLRNSQGVVRVLDLGELKTLQVLRGHTDGVSGVAVSPDGRTIASAGMDRVVKWWNLSPAESVSPSDHSVWSVAFSPDSKTCAAGGTKRTLSLWDVATGKLRASLPGCVQPIHGVAFSPDGKTLASAEGDYPTSTAGVVRLWDVGTAQPRTSLASHKHAVFAVAFSPDGRTLASGGGQSLTKGEVFLWDIDSSRVRVVLPETPQMVRGLAFAPDGRTLAIACGDQWANVPGTLLLWDVAAGKVRATLEGHKGPVLSVAFAPDGRTLASASGDATVRLWDVATGREERSLHSHTQQVRSVAWSIDGRTLASASYEGNVKLWQRLTGREVITFGGYSTAVNAVAFSPDGRALVTGNGAREKLGELTWWRAVADSEATTDEPAGK